MLRLLTSTRIHCANADGASLPPTATNRVTLYANLLAKLRISRKWQVPLMQCYSIWQIHTVEVSQLFKDNMKSVNQKKLLFHTEGMFVSQM